MSGLGKVCIATIMMILVATALYNATGEKVGFETTVIMAIFAAGWIAHKDN